MITLALSAMALSEAGLDASAAISGRFDGPPIRSRTSASLAVLRPAIAHLISPIAP